jgi:hypothetical protein
VQNIPLASRPFLPLQLRAATGGDFDFSRRFAVALTSIALAGVGGGGGLDESTEDMYIPVFIRNKLGLGFLMPAICVGLSPWAASPVSDDMDGWRSAPSSTAASPTSLVASGPGKTTSSPDLESSGSGRVHLLFLPHLLR